MEHKKRKPSWPDALLTRDSEQGTNLLTWIFETWNAHADDDDADLRHQYRQRSFMLRNVEAAIRRNRRGILANWIYRIRLRRDIRRNGR